MFIVQTSTNVPLPASFMQCCLRRQTYRDCTARLSETLQGCSSVMQKGPVRYYGEFTALQITVCNAVLPRMGKRASTQPCRVETLLSWPIFKRPHPSSKLQNYRMMTEIIGTSASVLVFSSFYFRKLGVCLIYICTVIFVKQKGLFCSGCRDFK